MTSLSTDACVTMIWLSRLSWISWLNTLVITWFRWCYRGITTLVAVVWLCRVSRFRWLVTLVAIALRRLSWSSWGCSTLVTLILAFTWLSRLSWLSRGISTLIAAVWLCRRCWCSRLRILTIAWLSRLLTILDFSNLLIILIKLSSSLLNSSLSSFNCLVQVSNLTINLV